MNSATFWAKVDASGGLFACWPWTGALNEKGYGRVHHRGGHWRRAHRVSYELAHGSIPDGLVVMHECDNPRCVNPAHLRLGTVADNQADMVAKGRSLRGRSFRKVPASTVGAIRARRLSGETEPSLAAAFGLSLWVIQGICSGATYRASRPQPDPDLADASWGTVVCRDTTPAATGALGASCALDPVLTSPRRDRVTPPPS